MRLREYIAQLEAKGELLRISTKVDPRYEICEITDRVSKSEGGGKALLFENTGTDYPVLMLYQTAAHQAGYHPRLRIFPQAP